MGTEPEKLKQSLLQGAGGDVREQDVDNGLAKGQYDELHATRMD